MNFRKLVQAAAAIAVEIGRFDSGSGLHVQDRDGAVPLPSSLGYEHGRGLR